jgi:DNA-binding MarR family transcriptional regulator
MLIEDILAAGKVMLIRLDTELMPLGLSSAKLWALQSIALADEAVTVTQLAACMSTTKSNVTAMVDRLEADGLVTRQRSSDDRRTVHIELTATGRRQYEACMVVFGEVNMLTCELFSESEMSHFRTYMQRVIGGSFEE